MKGVVGVVVVVALLCEPCLADVGAATASPGHSEVVEAAMTRVVEHMIALETKMASMEEEAKLRSQAEQGSGVATLVATGEMPSYLKLLMALVPLVFLAFLGYLAMNMSKKDDKPDNEDTDNEDTDKANSDDKDKDKEAEVPNADELEDEATRSRVEDNAAMDDIEDEIEKGGKGVDAEEQPRHPRHRRAHSAHKGHH